MYVNGRWVRTVDRWDAARWAAHERAEREARERAEREARERAEREARERAEEQAKHGHEDAPKGSGSHDKPKPKGEEEKAGAKNTRTSAPPISKVASAETKKETKPTPPRPVLLLPKKPTPRGRG